MKSGTRSDTQLIAGAVATLLAGSLAAPGVCVAADAGAADKYPTRPIRLIAQFLPGTTTDIVARFIGSKLSDALGQQVVVDNRPGAGGTIGTDIAAKAMPDGYTLAMGAAGAIAIAPWLYPKLSYDPLRDLAPVSSIVTQAQVIFASPLSQVRSVKDLVEAAKAKPGAMNYASVGVGSGAHLAMEMFLHAAKVKLNHVPFKGSPPAYLALLAGEIPLMVDGLPAALPQIKAGKLRGLAVTSLHRQAFLPDVQTVAESGYPGFDVIAWTGLVAPAKTPAPILDKLNSEVNRIIKTPEARELLASNAFNVVGGTREEYAAFIKSEIAKFGRVIKEANIRLE
jgi:tripartite-type tricarboxylate transporter receptor subunit TctC